MKRDPATLLLGLAALVSLVAGVIWTATSLSGWAAMEARIDRKTADLRQLDRWARDDAQRQAAVRQYEALPTHQLPSMNTLIRDTLPPTIRADARRRESRTVWGGWQVQRMDVTMEEAPLDHIGLFVGHVEWQRPPWRLVDAHLRASDQAEGTAGVTLIFEGLEKR